MKRETQVINSKYYRVKVTYGKGHKPHISKHEESDRSAALLESLHANPFAFMKANIITVSEITEAEYYSNN